MPTGDRLFTIQFSSLSRHIVEESAASAVTGIRCSWYERVICVVVVSDYFSIPSVHTWNVIVNNHSTAVGPCSHVNALRRDT